MRQVLHVRENLVENESAVKTLGRKYWCAVGRYLSVSALVRAAPLGKLRIVGLRLA